MKNRKGQIGIFIAIFFGLMIVIGLIGLIKALTDDDEEYPDYEQPPEETKAKSKYISITDYREVLYVYTYCEDMVVCYTPRHGNGGFSCLFAKSELLEKYCERDGDGWK